MGTIHPSIYAFIICMSRGLVIHHTFVDETQKSVCPLVFDRDISSLESHGGHIYAFCTQTSDKNPSNLYNSAAQSASNIQFFSFSVHVLLCSHISQ